MNEQSAKIFPNSRQLILVSGLFVMIMAIGYSIVTLLNLKDSIQSRRETFETRAHIDDLQASIKNWGFFIKHNGGKARSEELLIEIDKLELDVENNFTLVIEDLARSGIETKKISELKLVWRAVSRKPFDQNIQELQAIDHWLLGVDQDLAEKLKSIEPLVSRGIQHPLMLMAIMVLISFAMITFSFLSMNREYIKNKNLLIEMSRLQEESQSALVARSKFLATVSHEIRTPLNGIIGISDILRRKKTNLDDHQMIEVIHGSGKTLLRIINDILDFSKIESDRFKLEKNEFDLTDVLSRILLTLRSRAEEKSLNLIAEIDPTLPKRVIGDPDRLTQIIFNLLGNSIKFTASGSVIINVVKVKSIGTSSALLRFTIKDSGIGMSTEDLNNIFKPFLQLQKIGTSGEAGSGLGLSISQSLVQSMGGKIDVSSQIGIGSTFKFDLIFPVKGNELVGQVSIWHPLASTEQKMKEVPKLNNSIQRRLLVVEDNPTNQLIAQSMLAQFGIEPLIASDGMECLTMVTENEIDLILMDCQMPKMDGFEATEELRKRGVSIPILAMTANVAEDDKKKCIASGMNGIITKPMTLDSLYEKLKIYFADVDVKDDFNKLESLGKSIGEEALSRVLKSYLSSLVDFRTALSKHYQQENLDELRRLGHKYKSSSLMLGASQFAGQCKKLETLEELKDTNQFIDDLIKHSLEISNQLTAKVTT